MRSFPSFVCSSLFFACTLAGSFVAQADAASTVSHEGSFVAIEHHASLFSDIANRSVLAQSFGYALRGGYRWNGWGAILHFEHNLWRTSEIENKVVPGALNLGIGGEYVYADGFVRSSLVLGPSVLAYDTLLDKQGTVGLFFDLRPAGLRWKVHDKLILGLDPINFTVVAPVLTGVPLIYIQYRTVLYLEVSL